MHGPSAQGQSVAPSRTSIAGFWIVVRAIALHPAVAPAQADCGNVVCEGGAARASGPPDREFYASGARRVDGHYVGSMLAGPIAIRNSDGSLFLRGFLEDGEWSGALEIFHETGAVWFEAEFRSGSLVGPLRTRYPDGALESETCFQTGREDGLARSFYPSAAGGRLKSEAHAEADEIVVVHRLLDRNGEVVRSIDSSEGPPLWRRIREKPAAPNFDRASDSASSVSDLPGTSAKSKLRD
ncbi:MAG: hypothetical protein H8E78_04560 [Proteobacteria bacterium]|nr:hypothetical protein [Pseudomonadota bacterium]